MADERERFQGERKTRAGRGGLWRAIELFDEAAADLSASGDWIDEALADALASPSAAMGGLATMTVSPLGDGGAQRSWTHLWRCRPEGLPAARSSQCCTGALGASGVCTAGSGW
jgi:hypothetical protein